MEIAASSSSPSSSSSHSQQSPQHWHSGQQNPHSPQLAHSLLGSFEATEASLLSRVNGVNRLHCHPLERVGAAESATKGFRVRRSHPPPLAFPPPTFKKMSAECAGCNAGNSCGSRAGQDRMLEDAAFELPHQRRRRASLHNRGGSCASSGACAECRGHAFDATRESGPDAGNETDCGLRNPTEHRPEARVASIVITSVVVASVVGHQVPPFPLRCMIWIWI